MTNTSSNFFKTLKILKKKRYRCVCLGNSGSRFSHRVSVIGVGNRYLDFYTVDGNNRKVSSITYLILLVYKIGEVRRSKIYFLFLIQWRATPALYLLSIVVVTSASRHKLTAAARPYKLSSEELLFDRLNTRWNIVLYVICTGFVEKLECTCMYGQFTNGLVSFVDTKQATSKIRWHHHHFSSKTCTAEHRFPLKKKGI